MSTIIIAVVLVGLIVAVCLLLVIMNNKQKRKALNRLLHEFSKTGTEHNLTFSSQEILKNCIVGLDGVKRKVLVLEKLEETDFHSFVIDLNAVKSCSVNRLYGTVSDGEA